MRDSHERPEPVDYEVVWQHWDGTIAYFNVVSAGLGIIPGAILRYVLPVTLFYPYFIVIGVLGPRSAIRR